MFGCRFRLADMYGTPWSHHDIVIHPPIKHALNQPKSCQDGQTTLPKCGGSLGFRVQNLFQGFNNDHVVVVPASPLDGHTAHVHPILRLLAEIPLLLQSDELEAHRVDGDSILPRKVLQHTGEEGVGEEEATDPELDGRAVVHPRLEHVEPVDEIVEVAVEGFHGGVAGRSPQNWHFLIEEIDGECLNVG